MAELGDFFSSSNEKPSVEVTVDMMDYSYIRECKDASVLKEILSVLKSGKEGYYPDLMKFTEDRLMDILPPKEKLKILRLRKEATPSEILEAETELQKWQSEVASKDAELRTSAPSTKPLPPVRGRSQPIVQSKPVSTKRAEPEKEPTEKPKRLSGYDFRAWEKFDADAEAAKVDDPPEPTPSLVFDRVSKEQQQQREKHLRQLEEFRRRVNYDSLTPLQRQSQADRERQKGNEAFKTSSYEEAFHYYTLSLALSPTAMTYANRALVHLRQNNFSAAEADCSASLEIDNIYVKAWSRRGLCRFKSGKYAESIQDFEHAMTLSPDNKELASLLAKAKDKYYEVEGKEYSSSSNCKHAQRENADDFSVDVLSVTHARQLFALGDVMEIAALPLLSVPKEGSGFTRIAIESDDEDEPPPAGDSSTTFTRIAIEDDDESDNDNENAATPFTRVPIAKESEDEPAEAFTRVAISMEDSDEEKEEQQEISTSEVKSQADKHMQAQEFEKAICLYTDIINRGGDDDISVAALSNRTLAWLQLKNYSAVINDATLLLGGRASPVHVSKAHFRRALAYESTQRYLEALQDVDQVLSSDATNAVALKMRERLRKVLEEKQEESAEYRAEQLNKQALQAYGDGRYSEAISYIEQALPLTSSLPLRHLLSTCYSSTGHPDKALNVALEILQMDATNFKAIVRVAELYLEKGDNEKAQEYVTRAQSIDASAQQLIPLLEALAPTPAPTSTTCEKAASSGKSSAELSEHYKQLGNKAIAAQDFPTAIKHYTTAISHDSSNIACYNNRSLAFLKSNQFEYAEMDASVVLKHGDNAKAFYRRAIARKNLRKYATAMEDICTLLFIEPQNKEAAKEKMEIEDLLMLPTAPRSAKGEKPPTPPPAEVLPGMSVRSTVTKKKEISTPAPPKALSEQSPQQKPAAKTKTTPTSTPKLRAPAVPTEPPATLYELERIWRGLKNYPDLFAAYLKTFKKSTFKRVLKDAVSQDLLADIYAAVRNVLVEQDSDVAKRVMTGMTAVPKFEMMISLLPEDVLTNIREIVCRIQDNAALKTAYGV